MLRQLFGSRRPEPRESNLVASDPTGALTGFREPALRQLFVSIHRGELSNDYARLRLATEVAHAAAFVGDPLPLALELLDLAPRWDAWCRKQRVTPERARLDGALGGALEMGLRTSVAHHGERLPFSSADLARALIAAAEIVALGNHSRSYGAVWLEPLVREAAARNDLASRAALVAAFERLIAAKTDRNTCIERVEALLPTAGLARTEVPGLVAFDARGIALDLVRDRVFAALGEPLGSALKAVLDDEGAARNTTLSQTVNHPAMRALADLSPAGRGAAFHRLVSWLATNTERFENVGWHEVQKRRGRYRLELALPEMPAEIGNVLGVLALRKIELVDPDGDAEAFLRLLPYLWKLRHKKVFELIFETIARHPHGRASQALKAALEDERVITLDDYRLQAEDVLRSMPSATAPATPGVFGRKGLDAQPRLEGLPPLAPPEVKFDAWNATNILGGHFDNLLDVRLFDAPHRALLDQLGTLAADLIAFPDASPEELRKITERMRALPLGGCADREHQGHFVDQTAAFGEQLHARFAAAAPFVTRNPEIARQLSRLAAEVASKSAPTAKWLVEGRQLLSSVSRDERLDLLRALAAAPSPGGQPVANNDAIRTIIFLSADIDAEVLGPLLTTYALKRCYVTEPGMGIRNEKLGNACLWTLAALPDGAGVPFLARILARTKYPKIKAKVDIRLNEAAAAAGIDRATLDELSVPTHDLDRNGQRTVALGGGTATLRVVDGRSVTIDWAGSDGRALKAPSAAMKDDGDALKAVRAAAKELEADLSVQPSRIQRLYLEDRHWPAAVWRERYLDHPLLRAIASRLIWSVERVGTTVTALAGDEGLADAFGQPVSLEEATVRLWHPVDATPAEIEAWRDRLEALQLTQPFAQAWREVYTLTDAERTTATYTNRWAAHLLKQHQAMTLARLNGWRVTHRVAFDTPNDQPWHLEIPAHGLVVDYWVEGTGGDDPETSENGAYTYVATDRVQFHAAGRANGPRGGVVPLVEVPAVVFSEVMRHADLFTSVASIAADPNWLDRGGDAAHPSQWDRSAMDYWHRSNTAALETAGNRRRAMLERIVPRLKIAPRLALDDRYLMVQGTRHRYRIHLGSGACFREERHICIVPAQERQSGRVWLPFEGDRTLSIILSKAALLAADDRITDPVILAQL